jgi:hypothetical protein
MSETITESDRRTSRARRRATTSVSRFSVKLTRVGLRNDLGLAMSYYCVFYAQKFFLSKEVLGPLSFVLGPLSVAGSRDSAVRHWVQEQ